VILRISDAVIRDLQKPSDFCNILQQLCSLVRLSDLQQELLSQISQTKLNTTQFATQFNIDRAIPKSTIWFNLRKLRDSRLVKFNSKLTLTKVGKILSQSNSEQVSANLRKQISQSSLSDAVTLADARDVRAIVEQAAVARKVGGANPSFGTCHMARGKNE
jgi:hypothetical protein